MANMTELTLASTIYPPNTCHLTPRLLTNRSCLKKILLYLVPFTNRSTSFYRFDLLTSCDGLATQQLQFLNLLNGPCTHHKDLLNQHPINNCHILKILWFIYLLIKMPMTCKGISHGVMANVLGCNSIVR